MRLQMHLSMMIVMMMPLSKVLKLRPRCSRNVWVWDPKWALDLRAGTATNRCIWQALGRDYTEKKYDLAYRYALKNPHKINYNKIRAYDPFFHSVSRNTLEPEEVWMSMAVAVNIAGHFKYEHNAVVQSCREFSLAAWHSTYFVADSTPSTPHHYPVQWDPDSCQRLLSCCMLISVRVYREYVCHDFMASAQHARLSKEIGF